MENEFLSKNEPAQREAPEPLLELQPGQPCVLANIGGALVRAEIRAAQRSAAASCYRPLLKKLVAPAAAANTLEQQESK